MAKLTRGEHADAASALMGFYQHQAETLEESGHFFMAGVAFALALESSVLAYMLVKLEDEKGEEVPIPASVGMADLLEAANKFDVLSAPIDYPSNVAPDDNKTLPKHVAKDVVDKLWRFRNLIHPARALRQSFDPQTFTREQLQELKEIYESVGHSLIHNL